MHLAIIQTNNKETLDLNYMLYQTHRYNRHIENIYPRVAEHKFPSKHGIFSSFDRMLGHNTDLKKLKKIKMIAVSFPTIMTLNLKSIIKIKLENSQIHKH